MKTSDRANLLQWAQEEFWADAGDRWMWFYLFRWASNGELEA